ncbi:MAG TPA: hypothetical protein DDW93_08940, partial [Firmicutes bacterium]|nr:hypothetical protein [Bacillota bacterium]
MKRSKRGLVLILLFVFSFGTEAAFVLLDTSGRSDALGGCGVAGIGSNLKNPANVLEDEKCSLTLFHTDLYNLDLPLGTLEIQGIVLGAPLALTVNKLVDGDRPYQESAYTLTTGGRIGKIAAGVNLRRVLLSSEVHGEGWAFDLGSTMDFRSKIKVGVA